MLHLLACDDWGGTEVQVSAQVIGSSRTQWEQNVATLAPAGVVCRRLREAGRAADSLSGRGGPVGAAWRLRGILASTSVEVVVAYGFRAGLVARAAVLLRGRARPRLVIGVRGLHFTEAEEPDGLKTRVVMAVERLLSWSVASYDANSQGARDFLVEHGFPARKFTVIPNGVDLDVPQASVDEREIPRIVCTARFVPRKRHEVLLESLAMLERRGVPFSCELIGYGPTFDAMTRLASRLGLGEHVQFSGRVPQSDIPSRLATADVFVLTSLWEGMPGGVLEAMAAGLPVVGTDVNGTAELVEDGTTGFLVPPDDAESLADATQRVLTDRQRRVTMGAEARRRAVAEHSFEVVYARKIDLYSAVARRR